jgi:hypothetical protein
LSTDTTTKTGKRKEKIPRMSGLTKNRSGENMLSGKMPLRPAIKKNG